MPALLVFGSMQYFTGNKNQQAKTLRNTTESPAAQEFISDFTYYPCTAKSLLLCHRAQTFGNQV